MPNLRKRAIWTVFGFAVGTLLSSTLPAEDQPTFNRDIRPILAEHCFACHGFDAKQRKADLRLDLAEGAYADRDGLTPLKPHDLEASEVWQRITSDDPTAVMPPPSTKKQLTAAQKETLRRWIEQGAVYQKHWAFEVPVAAEPPAVKAENWIRTPVDRFILAKQESLGVSPRPEADRPTLIRRVAFALTGLPPTVPETAEYLADTSPQAYENMVDRYLASPHYGEEMGRHWLDVARYADTHGLHLDNERTMWAYRDWVIQSFNRNQPFDAFTIEQLAGDLLPDPTPEQLVATGFNRCNVSTSEGGSIESEFLYRYAVDRTSTMIQAWMGLTGGCAVCHDHKYDPLSTREFYSLYAFFYSAADPAMDRNANNTDPYFKLSTPEQKSALAQLQEEVARTRRELDEAAARLEYVDPATLETKPESITGRIVWLDDLFPNGARVTCSSRNPSLWSTAAQLEPARGLRSLKQAGAANYQDKFENPLAPLVIPANASLSVAVLLDAHSPPEALLLEVAAGKGTRKFVWGTADRYGMKDTDETYLGPLPEVRQQWTRLEIPASKLGLTADDSVKSVTLAQFGGIVWWDDLGIAGDINPATDPCTSFAAWWKDRTGKDTPGVPAELAPVLKEGPEKMPADELKLKLQQFYLSQIFHGDQSALQGPQQAWELARAQLATLEDLIPGTFIFKDLAQPREAFVMARGQYDKPTDKVEPAVPAVLPTLQKADGRLNRLDLARWLVSREHPLTARVTVNRFWQQFFGTGLVKTSDDFGSRGEAPSHPELLDWLALWYQDHVWDTKALVKLLVMSATFRQDAQLSPELYERDPENRLLARGPRFRLDAEQIRDNALFVGGLIDLKMGGEGAKSYQPPNIWEPVGYTDSNTRFYLQDHGADLYRRSIYCFLKRTAPPPFMSNFDAPNREQLCARRERSNTPLQALQLLNDTQHFEAARGMGQRLLAEGGATTAERITYAYRTVLSREPREAEQKILQQVLDQYLQRYAADPEAAKEVIAVGESAPDARFAPGELAAYTLLSNLILNLDETLTRN